MCPLIAKRLTMNRLRASARLERRRSKKREKTTSDLRIILLVRTVSSLVFLFALDESMSRMQRGADFASMYKHVYRQ